MSAEIIPATARPRLTPGVRMRTDKMTHKPVLLFPEGMLALNATGAAIIQACDGRRSFEDIVVVLAEQFNAPPGALRADVAGYLFRLRARTLIDFGVKGTL